MKHIVLATVAAAAIASPAAARDGAPYIGAEAGLLIPRDQGPGSNIDRQFPGGPWVDFLRIDHSFGFDGDLIGGYDFGIFRLEGELGWKHASHKHYKIDADAPGPFPGGGTEPVVPGANIDANGRTNVASAMINALADFDIGDRSGVYAGAGAGVARVSMTIDRLGDQKLHFKDTDPFAWQIIAGFRTAISDDVDIGIKYRFFSAGTLKTDFFNAPPGFRGRGSFQSHSVLASVVYNFGVAAPAPPPPPPPPPPPTPPAATTTPIAASDADLPEWFGDRCDSDLSGSASTSAGASGARRTGLISRAGFQESRVASRSPVPCGASITHADRRSSPASKSKVAVGPTWWRRRRRSRARRGAAPGTGSLPLGTQHRSR